MVLRYLYTSRDSTRITEFFFWPMIDIGFFGLIATWTGQLSNQQELVSIFVTALVLWQIVYRANFEICVNMNDEFLDQNLVNIVASPLKKGEWVIAMMLSGVLKIIFTLLFGALIAYLFFSINIFAIGLILWPLILLCLVSGWMIGFFAAGIVIRKGSRLQSLPWVITMSACIFSSVFYPLSVIPLWMRRISEALPMSYIFEAIRSFFLTGSISPHYWYLSTSLSIIYLGVAIKFFLIMFEKSLNRGFSKLL